MRALLVYLYENLFFLLILGFFGGFLGVVLTVINRGFLDIANIDSLRVGGGATLAEINGILTPFVGVGAGILLGIFRVGREREEQQKREDARILD